MLLVETIEPTEKINCICRQTIHKKKATNRSARQADSAELEICKRCCVNGKCTVNQLLKICQEDPDSIMNAFKIATAEEKCLPEVELDKDVAENDLKEGDNKADRKNKYHFLMVDNSTSLYRLQLEVPPVGERCVTGEDILEKRQEDTSVPVTESTEEGRNKSLTPTTLPSNESKYDTESSIMEKSASLERIFDKCRKIILWSDSEATDDQTPSSSNSGRRMRKKSGKRGYPSVGAGSDKSSDGEEQERTKSIVWSSESYIDSVDTTGGQQIPHNWYLSPASSERSSITPTSHLSLVVRQKKVQLSDELSASVRTVIGSEEVPSKTRSKYWPRCFNCFKRRKKDRQPDKKRKPLSESTNETEETETQY